MKGDGVFRFLSLGAGVQSSTIFLMSCYGELEKIDAAVFADTGWEPKAVYEWLEFLKSEGQKYGIPIHIVQQGNIKKDALVSQVRGVKKDGVRWASMPYFTRKVWRAEDISQLVGLVESHQGDGKNTYEKIIAQVLLNGSYVQAGMIRRQCTYEYKIRILEKTFRRLAGYKPYKRMPAGTIEVWKGISTDEANRVTMSNKKWQAFYYPLIERRVSRGSCLYWFKKRGMPRPPRSACIGCPYHHDNEWRKMRDESPGEFQAAVEFDRVIRKCGGIRGDVFIHSKRIPLDEVDLRTDRDKGQLSLWSDECAGVCGV